MKRNKNYVKTNDVKRYVNEFTVEEMISIYMSLKMSKEVAEETLCHFSNIEYVDLNTRESIDSVSFTLDRINTSMDKIEKTFALDGIEMLLKNLD